jgi:D-amino-acid oxidase
VIGAGVIGLTCAVTLAEAGARVDVLADQIPGATSLAAGALWGPYLVEPKDRVRRWALTSFARFAALAGDETNGVRMARGVEASRTPAAPPDFTDMVPDLTVLSAEQLPGGFRTGVAYTAPLVDMPVYLSHLRSRLASVGGRVREGRVAALAQIAQTVVNCAGLGAAALASDSSLYPIRGQLVVAQNPGLTHWFSEDTGTAPELTHWYPHGTNIVLGGLAAVGDASREPDPAIGRAIVERCAAIEPRLAGARILEHRVGLRPTRPVIRLEAEQGSNGARVVHCYGHGGAGVTLSWGCAEEVCDLVIAGH